MCYQQEAEGAFHSTQNSRNFGLVHQNGMDHFSLVRLEYSGPTLKVVHFDWSGYLCRSVGLKCPVPFDKLVVPSTLFCILLTRTITKHTVAWVGSVQPECTIPLGTWNFRHFKPEHELNGKCPESLAWSYPTIW